MYPPDSSLYSVVQLYLKKTSERTSINKAHVTHIRDISQGMEELWKFEVEDEE
jgi:hypothetical protein